MLKLLFSLVLLLPIYSSANTILNGEVVRVSDGDTVSLKTANSTNTISIRLAQIDAPEISHYGKLGQEYGTESRLFLRSLVFHKVVKVEVSGIDPYNRSLGVIYKDGVNINSLLVANGYAWVYREYKYDPVLVKLEDDAKMKKLGLWNTPSPIYPSVFRRSNK